MAQNVASQEFTSFYLQRTTQEFAEDLDKVREADDFKVDSLPFLIHALQQGTALYSAADQARVVRPAAVPRKVEDDDVDMDEPQTEKKPKSSKKEKSKRRKSST